MPRRTARSAPCAPEAEAAAAPGVEPRVTKTVTVLEPLRREDGATFAALIGATGFLSYTTRAALTSLRKKDHSVERSSRYPRHIAHPVVCRPGSNSKHGGRSTIVIDICESGMPRFWP